MSTKDLLPARFALDTNLDLESMRAARTELEKRAETLSKLLDTAGDVVVVINLASFGLFSPSEVHMLGQTQSWHEELRVFAMRAVSATRIRIEDFNQAIAAREAAEAGAR